jgi:aquaporin Z
MRFGSVSGGAFNPAVAIGITVMPVAKAANLWVYLVANFAAGALAAITFKFINPEDK